jgi:predicted metal-binding protein
MAKVKHEPIGTALAKYVEIALGAGATDAKIIPADEVYTAEWVRLRCQYGCGMYGRCLSCPPHSPAPEQTRRVLAEYSVALLIHTDGEADVCEIATSIEREAFLDGYYKAFSFHAGPCHFCESCDPSKPCRNPSLARPAMEAAGIDVYATARRAGLPIEVLRTRRCPQNYYSLVLIE